MEESCPEFKNDMKIPYPDVPWVYNTVMTMEKSPNESKPIQIDERIGKNMKTAGPGEFSDTTTT